MKMNDTLVEFFAADANEHRWLTQEKRCDGCHHLTILHNNHCCSFCRVPGCECGDDGSNNRWDDFWDGGDE